MVGGIDVELAINDTYTEAQITISARDGGALSPQEILDAVVEAMLYEFGELPYKKRKLDS